MVAAMSSLRADADIPFPKELVYLTYRDKLPDLVPFLPNIRGIEVKSRRDEPGLVHLVNVWHGGGDIPAAARAFLSESMMSWTDIATWRDADCSVEWKTETHAFTEAVRCGGTNRFVETGPSSVRFEIRGEIAIDPKKIPVPRLISGRVAAAVEDFLLKKITPNLIAVSDGVRRFLEQERDKKHADV